jgi:hypothetical protein
MKRCTKCGAKTEEFASHSSWCRVCKNADQKKRYAKNPLKHRVAQWRRLYGIDHAEYSRILAAQGGGCAVCEAMSSGVRREHWLHVDHDHITGRVRGVLCTQCNRTLGLMKNDPERLRKAAEYLEKF